VSDRSPCAIEVSAAADLHEGDSFQVMAETSGNVAVAFDQIDKAPEEKARGITIATAHGMLFLLAGSVAGSGFSAESLERLMVTGA
jgi:hypothetical protein